MGKRRCPDCGGAMIKYGKTKAGSQRWQCPKCKSTATGRNDNTAKLLSMFLSWLLSGKTQDELGVKARTFRDKCARFWTIWPLPPIAGEVHRVVFVDGIRVADNVHVLIACTEKFVIGWYLARSENSRAWGALMRKIPPPDVVVADGGSGFERARKKHWPQTCVQRCLFHVFGQVKRQTTTRPKLQAGVELYGLARDLLHARDLDAAIRWLAAYSSWCTRWEDFLSERTLNEETGKMDWTHKPLVTARNGLNRLVKDRVLFTFLDPALTAGGPLPATNNRLEGGVNAQIRAMWRDHRGMSTARRAKAAFWWCYMHSECPLPAAEILRVMPTDDDIAELYQREIYEPQKVEGPAEWGDGMVWAELHRSTGWRMDWD